MVWTEMAELPWARTEHCQIQIGDCEVAFIGGTKTTPGGTDSVTKDINIWNFKTNSDRRQIWDILVRFRATPKLHSVIHARGNKSPAANLGHFGVFSCDS